MLAWRWLEAGVHGVPMQMTRGAGRRFQSVSTRSRQRRFGGTVRAGPADAEGACPAAVPGREAGQAGDQARAARGAVAERLRGRRCAEGLHPRDQARPGRRCAGAAFHRDRASARLPVHCAGHADGGRPRKPPAVAPPKPEPHAAAVRYARSRDVNIAYQVLGSGPIDLVFVMGWVTHLDYAWRDPSFARFLRRLAESARLILFDKRGTGSVRSGHRDADARAADGRRARGHGCRRIAARRAARRVGRRADVQPLCGHLSGPDGRARS